MAIFSRVMFLRAVGGAARPRAGVAFFRALLQNNKPSNRECAGRRYAYWYLRRHGYVFVARNFTVPGVKGEIDLIGYDGPVLAFVEVKTRSTDATKPAAAGTARGRRHAR